MNDRIVEPGSETDLAIERALEAANLRAGDSATSTSAVVEGWEPSAAEAGDIGGAVDGD
ncbi:hypothetical protein [Agromyces sp. Marseille-P2726]|uniref:hypothetical protein n=1 Tax=Agromyces sp. Marseille-P2726 TaxID=2709132 RepID=UPI00156FF446|nr:hypothetical protein [Agromyces sp. Marseille-P2726]